MLTLTQMDIHMLRTVNECERDNCLFRVNYSVVLIVLYTNIIERIL